MKLYIFLFCSMLSLNVFAEEEAASTHKDPFDSVIPEETTSAGVVTQRQDEAIAPPKITVEGIIWGVETPQTIIDGEVYKTGDTLKNAEAKIFKIEKNVVMLEYKGKIFESKIQKGTTEQKEAR
jgi:type II secretory pathway component PulC